MFLVFIKTLQYQGHSLNAGNVGCDTDPVKTNSRNTAVNSQPLGLIENLRLIEKRLKSNKGRSQERLKAPTLGDVRFTEVSIL